MTYKTSYNAFYDVIECNNDSLEVDLKSFYVNAMQWNQKTMQLFTSDSKKDEAIRRDCPDE